MKLLEQLRREIRLRHYSIRTEHAYSDWVVRYVHFHNLRHPKDMGAAEISAFLSHLATDANVAASTQNQALCALVFLYKNVLGRDPGDFQDVVRAKRPARMPVVLTVEETQRILSHMTGAAQLKAILMYGTGMRIIEVIRLRVKDVDFDNHVILVRDGKGEKDRYVPLPNVAVESLRGQIARTKLQHEEDLRDGYGTVYLPYALERKYPNTNKAFHWQYVFPSQVLSVDPRSGVRQRHHVYESVLQQAIRQAAAKAGIMKDVHSHTFRHSCATHMLASGSDIRTVQELLGHNDVRTTQIYTHVLHMGPQGVVSPADRISLTCYGSEVPRNNTIPRPLRSGIGNDSGLPCETPCVCPVAPPLPAVRDRTGVIVYAPPAPGRPRAAGAFRSLAAAVAALMALALRTWTAWRGGQA